MKFLKLLFVLILLPSLCIPQDALTVNLVDQYQDLKANTETYNEYKVIRETRLDDWFNSIQDTLQGHNTTIKNLKQSVSILEDTISNLNGRLSSIQQKLSQGEFEKTHISMLGLNFSKGAFRAILSISVIGLLIVIVFLSVKVIDSGKTTRDTLQMHDTLIAEFEEFKKRSLEKQTKLARDLQTERNKFDELKKKR